MISQAKSDLYACARVCLVAASLIALLPQDVAAAESRTKDYSSAFAGDIFGRHHSREDFRRLSDRATYWRPAYSASAGHHHRYRFYRIGTYHHYSPLETSPGPPLMRDIIVQKLSPRFPFFPHRPATPPGQFWWNPASRRNTHFWRSVIPSKQPKQHYREFFDK